MTPSDQVTALTDILLAGVAATLGSRLIAAGRRQRRRAVVTWGGALWTLGGAALAGGAYHGLEHALPARVAAGLWIVTLVTLGAASALLALALSETLGSRGRRAARVAVGAGCAAYAALLAVSDSFVVGITGYAAALAAASAISLAAWHRERAPSAPWILGGVVVTAVGSAVQQTGLELGSSVDANAIYHLIQLAAVWLLYRGGLELRDGEAGTPEATIG